MKRAEQWIGPLPALFTTRKEVRAMSIKECLFCKVEFATPYREVRYCSKGCKLSHLEREEKARSAIKGRRFKCGYCSKPFSPKTGRDRYCSPECATLMRKVTTGRTESLSYLSTGTIGAVGELAVSVDLLRLGYEVFRSVSPACSCDLVAFDGCSLLRLEVRTGYRSGLGDRITCKTDKRADVLAVYLPSEHAIYYDPPMPPLAGRNAAPGPPLESI